MTMSDLDIQSVLTDDLRDDLRKWGRENSKSRLRVARRLRDYIADMDEGEQFVEQVYEDASIEYQDAAPRTMRGWVEALSGFDDETIDYHFGNHIPFEMFVVARRLYNEYTSMDAISKDLHTGEFAISPEYVLQKAYMGGDNGNRNMTVKEVNHLFHGPGYIEDKSVRFFAGLRNLIKPQFLKEFDEIIEKVKSWIR
jgi:hypothetical protein